MATIGIIVLFMALFVGAWFIVEIGQQNIANELEYNDAYAQIDFLINDRKVNDHNYKVIMNRLMDLSRMKYKNREKTEVITLKFMRKFKASIHESLKDVS